MTRIFQLAVAGAVAVLATACSETTTVECPPGFGMCGGACVATSSDPDNCGACGNVCGDGLACASGACVVDCRAGLNALVEDRWGTAWDGLERPSATSTAATATCEALGGRLPTATEAWRVSWVKTGDVGQSYQTNFLLTLVPRDATTQFAVQMSTGSVSNVATTTPTPYRCVCPAAAPEAFSGYACNGPPGAECFSLGGANAGYAADAQDRAPLSKGGAMWECGFSRAALPDVFRYGEAVRQGLAGGSDTWLHTADDNRANYDTLVKWTGTAPTWVPEANVAVGTMTDPRPFRCVGLAAPPAPAPGKPDDAFVGRDGKAADVANRAVAGWAAAHQECWDAGGHLAYQTELGALVQQGLPGGAGGATWLWTAEQEGRSATNFLVGVLAWNGVDPRFGHYASTYVNWDYKYTTHPFRCVYYPVDTGYVAPTNAVCEGDCARFDLPGGSGAALWVDGADRVLASLASAMSTCNALGGHLATERDYTEAIRAGLQFGNATWLHAADFGHGEYGLYLMLVKWTANPGAAFVDQFPADMDWGTFAEVGNNRPYRCAWTNELR